MPVGPSLRTRTKYELGLSNFGRLSRSCPSCWPQTCGQSGSHMWGRRGGGNESESWSNLDIESDLFKCVRVCELSWVHRLVLEKRDFHLGATLGPVTTDPALRALRRLASMRCRLHASSALASGCWLQDLTGFNVAR